MTSLDRSRGLMLASDNKSALNGKLVLLADPDGETRRLHRSVLEGIGYDVAEAEDGREALIVAFSRRPSVIVATAGLAFIDGYALCELLRCDRETRGARIVVVSDTAHPLQIERARSAGADAGLAKPCLPGALAAEIQRIASRHEEVRQPASHRQSARKRFERFDTAHPPLAPPRLNCPSCERRLRYVRSHVGGVSSRHAEQWDFFECASCGTFQYRQRTRKLRPAGAIGFVGAQ